MGYLHVYCGDGKGKTTAALGLAVRMAGTGGRAVIVRFLKNDESGEIAALKQLDEITVIPCGKSFGFTWQMTGEQKAEASRKCREQFESACRLAAEACSCPKADGADKSDCNVLLVLDELCAAVNTGLLPLKPVLEFIDSRPQNLEIVATGREPASELLERAGYVTEFRKRVHPFDSGIMARKGIEY